MLRMALAVAAAVVALSSAQAQADNTTITFQSGRTIADLNKTSAVYNRTWETSINTQVIDCTGCAVMAPPFVSRCARTASCSLPRRFPGPSLLAAKHIRLSASQYIDSWNYFNGGSCYWGQWNYTVGRVEQFRLLMTFNRLNNYIPANATILSASLTLTFISWGPRTCVEGCFLQPGPGSTWSHLPPGQRFKGTGAGAGLSDCPELVSLAAPRHSERTWMLPQAGPLPASMAAGS
jgi:hypothetical protein